MAWTDPSDGSTSLQRVGVFLQRLLSPEVEEAAGLATGDLLVTLFRKTGDAVAPMMRPLLEVVVKRLNVAKTATGSQVRSVALESLVADGSLSRSPSSFHMPTSFKRIPTQSLTYWRGLLLKMARADFRSSYHRGVKTRTLLLATGPLVQGMSTVAPNLFQSSDHFAAMLPSPNSS